MENIVIAQVKIRFCPPDLTLVQSEMVVLCNLGNSSTKHFEWSDEGVLSVSGNCNLRITHHVNKSENVIF